MRINDKIQIIIASLTTLLLVACGTTTTTKTIKYDEKGNISEIVERSSDNSDLSEYFATSENNATNSNINFSKFSFGYLKWLSIEFSRTKAPVNNSSNSADTLGKMADVIKANKTTIDSEEIRVNK